LRTGRIGGSPDRMGALAPTSRRVPGTSAVFRPSG